MSRVRIVVAQRETAGMPTHVAYAISEVDREMMNLQPKDKSQYVDEVMAELFEISARMKEVLCSKLRRRRTTGSWWTLR